MIDLSVAITWIAISVVSVKGLGAFVRAAAIENEAESGSGLYEHEEPYSKTLPAFGGAIAE